MTASPHPSNLGSKELRDQSGGRRHEQFARLSRRSLDRFQREPSGVFEFGVVDSSVFRRGGPEGVRRSVPTRTAGDRVFSCVSDPRPRRDATSNPSKVPSAATTSRLPGSARSTAPTGMGRCGSTASQTGASGSTSRTPVRSRARSASSSSGSRGSENRGDPSLPEGKPRDAGVGGRLSACQ